MEKKEIGDIITKKCFNYGTGLRNKKKRDMGNCVMF